jgi:single-stranded-DNA-specific exonuclease
MLEHAGPYGAGHPAPVLVLPRHRITDIRVVGNGHLRVGLRSEMGGSLQAMAFRAETSPLGAFLIANRGQVVHVAGTLSSNFWNGRRSAQFRIVDAAGI